MILIKELKQNLTFFNHMRVGISNFRLDNKTKYNVITYNDYI